MDSFSILNQNHLQQALKALKIRTNLITNEQYLLEDPIRNGLLLYQILQEISLIQKKPNNPAKTLSECRENLLISLESLVKTPKIYNRLFSDIAESILKGNTNFIESIVNYINTHQHSHLRLNSLNFDKFLETFSKDFENNKKEKNLIEWLKDLGLFNKESLLSFDQILQETVKGDLLFKIYNKYNTKKMEPIRRFPKNDVNYLANLRKFLSHVRKIKNFPQKYLWMEAEIVKGSNKDLILGFLEDIKTGLENGYNEKTNISFEINSKDKQINLKTSQQFNDEIRGKMHCLISEREMNEMKFSERKYIEKKLEEKKFVPGETEAFQWLESLGFVNLVKELKENNEFWLEFQDGLILNRIILKIGINPCQLNEKPKTKASCIRNLKEILKLLLNQKYVNRSEMLWFDEETIFEATKYKIVEFLLTLKKNYEKKNKEKFQKIESPEHFFDRLLRIYVLKNKERKKMLVYPKYIDDDHF